MCLICIQRLADGSKGEVPIYAMRGGLERALRVLIFGDETQPVLRVSIQSVSTKR